METLNSSEGGRSGDDTGAALVEALSGFSNHGAPMKAVTVARSCAHPSMKLCWTHHPHLAATSVTPVAMTVPAGGTRSADRGAV